MNETIICVYGNIDLYKSVREKAFKSKLSPYYTLEFFDVPIKDAFNTGVIQIGRLARHYGKAAPCFIMCHNSVKPTGDWIKEFITSGKYKDYTFIVDSQGMYFTVINVLKVRKFGMYKRVGSSFDLYEWLKQKTISEGWKYRTLDSDEMNMVEQIEDSELLADRRKKTKKEDDQKEFDEVEHDNIIDDKDDLEIE